MVCGAVSNSKQQPVNYYEERNKFFCQLDCSLGRAYKKKMVCIEIYGLERTLRKALFPDENQGKERS